jgi:hypothetical protein
MKDPAELARARRLLKQRAARQRDELALACEPLLLAASRVDRAVERTTASVESLKGFVSRHPQMLAGTAAAIAIVGVAALFLRRPLRTVRLARLGVSAWQAWRWARIVAVPLLGVLGRSWRGSPTASRRGFL